MSSAGWYRLPLGELAATAQQAETDQVQTRLALNLRKTVELAVLSVGDDCLGEWGPEWCGNGSVTVLDKTLEGSNVWWRTSLW